MDRVWVNRLPQLRGEGGPASVKALIIAAPTRSQLAAVSAIKILLVGVERLILAPQLTQGIASFLTKTVTTFSVCLPWCESNGPAAVAAVPELADTLV
jgi:hypothetical protein